MHIYKKIVIVILLVFGLAMRLYLPTLVEHNFSFDMGIYHAHAHAYLQGIFEMDCCDRGVGYSIFLAFVYVVFGEDNYESVQMVQSIVDIGNTLLLFIISKKLFGNKVGQFAALVYFVNPFTAGFSGILMPEILTIFFMLLISLLLCDQRRKGARYLFIGILLGLWGFTRISHISFSFLACIVLGFVAHNSWKLRFRYFIVLLFGVLSIYAYPLVQNYRQFSVVSIYPPYNMGRLILYANWIGGRYPEVWREIFDDLPGRSYWKLLEENNNLPFDKRGAYQQEKFSLFIRETLHDPMRLVRYYIRNVSYLFDRRYILVYRDPFRDYMMGIRAINILLLLSFGAGVLQYFRKNGIRSIPKPILFMLLLLGYTVTLLPFLSNESRHTFPVFPVLILFAAYFWKSIFVKEEAHL